jgi:uncharacterized membrane protein (DUF485 family)
MNEPTDHKDAAQTNTGDGEQAFGVTYPFAKRSSEQISNPQKDKPKIADYKPGSFEAMPFGLKIAVLVLVFIVLIWISFCSGWITEKAIEFFVGSIITIALFTVALCQYYVYKRQTHAMLEGLQRTDELIKQTERHFTLTERPILIVDKASADITPNRPLVANIDLINKGRGMAEGIEVVNCISVNEQFSFKGVSRSIPHLPAQDPCTIHEKYYEIILTEDEVQTIMLELAPIFIYGKGSYYDLNGTEYILAEWAFRWTKQYGWINDYNAFDPAIFEQRQAELDRILGLPEKGTQRDDRENKTENEG